MVIWYVIQKCIPSQLCQKGVEVLGISLKTCSLNHTILISRTHFEFWLCCALFTTTVMILLCVPRNRNCIAFPKSHPWSSFSYEVETEGRVVIKIVWYFRTLSVSNKIVSRSSRYCRFMIYLRRLSGTKKFFGFVFLPGSVSFWWILESLRNKYCKQVMWLTCTSWENSSMQICSILSLVSEPLPAEKRDPSNERRDLQCSKKLSNVLLDRQWPSEFAVYKLRNAFPL